MCPDTDLGGGGEEKYTGCQNAPKKVCYNKQ